MKNWLPDFVSKITEALYLRSLLKEFKYLKDGPTILYEDNQGAIAIANNDQTSKRNKYIDIKHHFICEAIERKEIEIKYKPSEEMLADCLTIHKDKLAYETAKGLLFDRLI